MSARVEPDCRPLAFLFSHMPPKKLRQATLSFSPVAVLPDSRREGAVIVPGPVDVVSSSAPDPVPEAAPKKKSRRSQSYQTKHEIAKFRSTHTLQETVEHFPEVCERTIRRIKKESAKYLKAVHLGEAHMKRRRRLVMYFALGEKLNDFFILIRDAEGVVTGSLLEEFPVLFFGVLQEYYKYSTCT